MANPDCLVCRGNGRITLPLYYPVEVMPSVEADIRPSSKWFPCPECEACAPVERVGAIRQHGFRNPDITDPKYIEATKRDLVHRMLDLILRRGWIKFEEIEAEGRFPPRIETRATMWAVMPAGGAMLEARIAERQLEIATEVQEEAKRQIDNWGSYYGHSDILKRDARQMVDDASRIVLARRMAWKASA